ncbi:MAG TPA: hypothetical protein VLJ68_12545 [Chitinophagaceae bacterium]|nr:hypothetical protein [Chitinophagaceae bacterium]
MTISGFSYIRNGFTYEYPFLQSIQSILPICDEFVVAVGNSNDGTKEAILAIGSPKIRVIDTVWDEQLRSNGTIFAQQANIALMNTKGDWAFHIQADELIHEKDLATIQEQIRNVHDDNKVEGLLFDFLNFYGNYDYLNDTRNQHKKEIRVIRNHSHIYSYRDSQGFRKYPSYESYQAGHKGFKLKVKYIQVPVYHYSYVRKPEAMNAKSKYFETFWHNDAYVDQKYREEKGYDYYNIERVKKFEGSQPALMKEIIRSGNWDFDPSRVNKKLSLKDRIAYWIEDRIHYRIGEYKNYVIVK